MKLSVFVAAFLAGIVSFCAYASPIEISAMEFENDAYFIEDPIDSFSLHGFERSFMQRSGFEIAFGEPAVAAQPAPPVNLMPPVVFEPTEQGPVEVMSFSAPPPNFVDFRTAGSVNMSSGGLQVERVPEPGSLLLIGTGLLMLSSRRLFWRREF